MLNNNNIQIAMLELSDQNRAVLDFYFNSVGNKLFTVVDETKADAFIIDYDYPGAKDQLAKILSTHNKPVVLLSVREQKLDSTVWLAKPLTADALTKSADTLKQMIAANEVAIAELLVSDTVTAEAPATEIKNDETVAVAATKTLMPEDALSLDGDLDGNNDIFDILREVEQLDENKKIEARLAGPGAAALISATLSSNDDSQETAENTKSHEGSHLDFAGILLDSESDLEVEVEVDTESESEVDALLEALIQGEGNKVSKNTVSTENNDNEVFRESLVLDDELETNTIAESPTENPIELLVLNDVELDDTELEGSLLESSLLEDSQSKSAQPESKELEDATPEDIDLEDVDLLAEGIAFEEDSSILIEEKESVLIDENFTLHDDLDPSEEDVYADTLKVDYADIKTDNRETVTSTDEQTEASEIELEMPEESIQQENNLNTDLEESLENDLFNFDFESSKNTEETSLSIKSTEDIALALLNDAVDTDANSGVNRDAANFDTSNDSYDKNVDTDLDNLLQEVPVETDDFIETPQKVTEIASFITKTQSIKDDFDTKDEPAPISEKETDFDLQSLLNEVREEASDDTDGKAHSEKTSEYKQTNAEKRWMQLCGNYKNISSQKDTTVISFKLENHLLGVLLKQIESVKDSEHLYRLKYEDLIIVLDHSQNNIYCNLPIISDEYSEFCFSEIEHKKVEFYDLDYSEIRLYRKKIEENPDRAHTFESFIWSTSLLTSRGRLPDDTNVTKKVGLKVWPNLTRVELMPHAMQLAATFSKHPGNLLEIPAWLGIEQRYVFAFYNAALSLGILEFDSSKIKKSAFSFGKKDSTSKSEERSFFGRLLKRLKS